MGIIDNTDLQNASDLELMDSAIRKLTEQRAEMVKAQEATTRDSLRIEAQQKTQLPTQ